MTTKPESLKQPDGDREDIAVKRLVGLRGLVVKRRRDSTRFRILTAELRRDFGYRANAVWVTLREVGARKPVWSHRNNAPLLVRLDDYAF